MMRNISAWILAIFAILVAGPVWAQQNLNTSADGSGGVCIPRPGVTCFLVILSTQTPAEATSIVYQANVCKIMAFYMKGDGTARLQIKENNAKSTSGATIVGYDWNGDGLIDSSDESVYLDGSADKRAFAVIPKAPFEFVDVDLVTASGSASLAITCR